MTLYKGETMDSYIDSLIFADTNKIKFSSLDADIQNYLLGKMAKAEMWDELLAGSKYINLMEENRALDHVNFHQWLLTNPNDRAFEIWLKIRSLNKENGTYSFHDYADSAALVLYANLPRRLSSLDKTEWEGGIANPSNLHRGKIYFAYSGVLKKQERINLEKGVSTRIYLTPFEISLLQGNLRLAQKSLDTMTDRKKINVLVNKVGYFYLLNKNNRDIDSIIEFLKNSNKEIGKYAVAMLFKDAIEILDKEELESLWGKIDGKIKDMFIQNINERPLKCKKFKEATLSKGRIDIAGYIESLENNGKKVKISYSFQDLWDYAKTGKIEVVGYLLDKHPEWLNNEALVYHDGYIGKKGTILDLSVMNFNDEMIDFLLSRGASLESLKSLADYIRENDGGNKFIINAERIMIKSKYIAKSTKSNKINKPVL